LPHRSDDGPEGLPEKTPPASPPDGGSAAGRRAAARPKPEKPKSAASAVEKPPEVDAQVWHDFLILRKNKKAPLTATALQGIAREAMQAGIALQEALQTCCEAGWQGFKSAWYENRMRKNAAFNDTNAANIPHAGNFTPIRPRYMTAAERRDIEDEKTIERVLAGKSPYTSGQTTIDVEACEIKPQADIPYLGKNGTTGFSASL